jgi:hypothetical protein
MLNFDHDFNITLKHFAKKQTMVSFLHDQYIFSHTY